MKETTSKHHELWTDKYNWTGKLVLIVEDIEANHMFIAAALKKTHTKLLWAKDGLEAIDLCEKHPEIDLVLMDIRMPNLDGYEATKRIKVFRPDLPIIAQTAYVMNNEKGLVLQAGCDDLITKPIKLQELLTTVAKYI